MKVNIPKMHLNTDGHRHTAKNILILFIYKHKVGEHKFLLNLNN